uniref:Flavin-containing monooxygenase n=1 Tax=Rhabditophanes sp. KR3021 TaxID=114890 RepID=A0AC35TVT6_9BILA
MDNNTHPVVNNRNLNLRICIIGAGLRGLTAWTFFKNEGFRNVVLYEKEKEKLMTRRVGKHISSNVFEGEICSMPHPIIQFPNCNFKGFTTSYPTKAEVLNYLEQIGSDLDDQIEFNHKVIEAIRKGNNWEVETRHEDTGAKKRQLFDVLLICCGRKNLPFIPKLLLKFGVIQSECKSTRTIIHSREYKGNEKYVGKVLALIGRDTEKLTAILRDVHKVASKVYVFDVLSYFITSKMTDIPKNVEFITLAGYTIDICGTDISTLSRDKPIVDVDVLICCTGFVFDLKFLTNYSQLELSEDGKLIEEIICDIFSIRHIDSMFFIGLKDSDMPFRFITNQLRAILSKLNGTHDQRFFQRGIEETLIEKVERAKAYRLFKPLKEITFQDFEHYKEMEPLKVFQQLRSLTNITISQEPMFHRLYNYVLSQRAKLPFTYHLEKICVKPDGAFTVYYDDVEEAPLVDLPSAISSVWNFGYKVLKDNVITSSTSKGLFFNHQTKWEKRYIIYTKNGLLLIYKENNKGFLVDIQDAKSIKLDKFTLTFEGVKQKFAGITLAYSFGKMTFLFDDGQRNTWCSSMLNNFHEEVKINQQIAYDRKVVAGGSRMFGTFIMPNHPRSVNDISISRSNQPMTMDSFVDGLTLTSTPFTDQSINPNQMKPSTIEAVLVRSSRIEISTNQSSES